MMVAALFGGFDIAEEVSACDTYRSASVDHGFQAHWSVFCLDCDGCDGDLGFEGG